MSSTSETEILTSKLEAARPAPPAYWPPPQGRWTYADYARLPDNGFRYEVIHGALIMSPAPRPHHQRVVKRLALAIERHLEAQPSGELFLAPIDVILPGLADPVQPDLAFVAAERLGIVSETRIEAEPDLVVEVVSPGSEARDRRLKFGLYAQAGVREYWIVDPSVDSSRIEVYVLRGHAYALAGSFGPSEAALSEVLEGFAVRVDTVCAP